MVKTQMRSNKLPGELQIFATFFVLFFTRVYGSENELYDYLFKNESYHRYMVQARPQTEKGTPIEVIFTITVAQIVDVDERSQTIKVSIWPQCEWFDERMVFPKEMYDGASKFSVSLDSVWRPEVMLLNNADRTYEPTFPSNVLITPEGNLSWLPPSIFVASCNMDMNLFPYDTQHCALRFVSVNYDASEIQLLQGAAIYDNPDIIYESTEWELQGVSMNVSSIIFPGNRNHSEVITTFHLKRKPLFYEATLVAPMFMLNLVGMMTFLLPSYGGTKLNITANIFLAFTMPLLIIVRLMPTTANNVPMLIEYCFFSLLMACLNTVFCVIVVNIHWRSPSTDVMAKWFRWLTLETLPKFILMRRAKLEERRQQSEDLKQFNMMYCSNPTFQYHGVPHDVGIRNDFARFSSAGYLPAEIRPVIGGPLLNIAEIPSPNGDVMGYHHPFLPAISINTEPMVDDDIVHQSTRLSSPIVETTFVGPYSHTSFALPPQWLGVGAKQDNIDNDHLLAITEELEAFAMVGSIADYMRRKDEFVRKNDDWTFAALVVNRIFFIIYSIILSGGTYCIFWMAE